MLAYDRPIWYYTNYRPVSSHLTDHFERYYFAILKTLQKERYSFWCPKTSFDADINFYTPTLKIRLIREDSCELLWDDLYDKLDEIYHLKWRVLDSNDEFETVNRTSNGYLIRDLTPSTSYETSIQV